MDRQPFARKYVSHSFGSFFLLEGRRRNLGQTYLRVVNPFEVFAEPIECRAYLRLIRKR
jgi:hypothetical protein